MSIWGAVGGLAGSLWSSSQNQASAQASMAFQREVLQNRNQWAVEDLKKAGLNPILAAGATQSSAAGAQATAENPGQSAANSAAAVNAMKIAERQQKNQDALAASQVEVNSAKADEYRQNIAESIARSGIYGPQAEHYSSSANFNAANADYLNWRSKEIEGQLKVQESQLISMEKEREEIAARIKTADSATARNYAEAALARKDAEIAEERKKGEKLRNEEQAIVNRIRELGADKKGTESRVYSRWNQVYDWLRDKDTKLGKKIGIYK